jgi:hypothetical protein
MYAAPRSRKHDTNLLGLALVGALALMVNATEVGHDNWNRQSYDQDTAQRTQTTHELAGDCVRNHIAVSANQTLSSQPRSKTSSSGIYRQVRPSIVPAAA